LDIPIKNLYYLLSYAWNKLELGNKMKLNEDDFKSSTNLFARVFDNILGILIKRGLDKNYIEKNEKIRGIKGKIDFNRTIKSLSHLDRKFYCEFDEFSANIIPNKIIKATLKLLISSKIDRELKKSLKRKILSLSEVNDIELTNIHFRKTVIDRNNSYYQFIIQICKLIFDSTTLDEETGNKVFKEFFGTDKQFAALFESFVLNFYKKHLPRKKYKVKGSEIINWDMEELRHELFPIMKTDITVETSDKKTIIDAKFYKDIFAYNYEKPKFHSNNLYQIYAYIKNYRNEEKKTVEGILLYPTTKQEVHSNHLIGGHNFRLMTINLNQDWRNIEEDLISIIE
jgi:5-methylcytosine-specific restriction enzyme subunit McrC